MKLLPQIWELSSNSHFTLSTPEQNFEHPRDARKEDIAYLLDKINLVDSSCKYCLRRCRMQSARWRWTWCQKRLGRWHYSHHDYILARGGETLYFRKVAFRTPLVHHSDHRAVVPAFRARKTKQLTKYPHRRQRLPLRLPPKPHDELTQTFEALKLTCKKSRTHKTARERMDLHENAASHQPPINALQGW